jgi:hypothetical protein
MANEREAEAEESPTPGHGRAGGAVLKQFGGWVFNFLG